MAKETKRLTRLPSLREITVFTMKAQEQLEDLKGVRHPYISVRWDCSIYGGDPKIHFQLNWELNLEVMDFKFWHQLKLHVEKGLASYARP